MKHLHPKWEKLTPNEKKTLRQQEVLGKFKAMNGVGYFLATTGFGKTRLALITIESALSTNPERIIHVIVPGLPLKEQWALKTARWRNVKVYVINTYIDLPKEEKKCDFLICDEVHRYTNKESEKFSTLIDTSTYKFFLGLSATLDEEKREFIESKGIPLIDEVTIQEARDENYVADFDVYAVGIPFNNKDQEKLTQLTKEFNRIFMHFNYDLKLMFYLMNQKNKKDLEEYALEKGWTIAETFGTARKGIAIMNERKQLLQKATSKIDAVQAITTILDNQKVITFSQFNDTVDALVEAIPGSKGYHSSLNTLYYDENGSPLDITTEEYKAAQAAGRKYKRKGKKARQDSIKRGYAKNQFKILHATKALDEGYDVEDITVGILTSYSSKPLQLIQRIGRAVRYVEGKKAIIIILYIDSKSSRSQEEKWLKEASKSFDMTWCDIDEFLNLMRYEKENYGFKAT